MDPFYQLHNNVNIGQLYMYVLLNCCNHFRVNIHLYFCRFHINELRMMKTGVKEYFTINVSDSENQAKLFIEKKRNKSSLGIVLCLASLYNTMRPENADK